MKRKSTPCPDCDGEGGHATDDEKPIRGTYDWDHGETYLANWSECETCRGTGEIDDDPET